MRFTGKIVVLKGAGSLDSSRKYANSGVEAAKYLLPVKTGYPCIVDYLNPRR